MKVIDQIDGPGYLEVVVKLEKGEELLSNKVIGLMASGKDRIEARRIARLNLPCPEIISVDRIGQHKDIMYVSVMLTRRD